MRDPFEHLLEPGPQGERAYSGLYVWPLTDAKGKTRWIVSRMKQTYDGGMREFINPTTGEVDGCCGCNFAMDGHVQLAFPFVVENMMGPA